VISVLLPYRDCAPTLEAAMESVLAERDVSLELIAIDDGSRDGGARIAERIAASDRRVVCVRAGGEGAEGAARGVGIAATLACGLRVARGDLIGRMDADDVSIPPRIGAAARLLAHDDRIAVAATRAVAFADGEVTLGAGLLAYVDWQNGLVTPEEHAAAMFVESPVCHPTVVIRRDALEAVGGWSQGRYAEDYELWLKLDEAGHGFAKVDGPPLFRWRHRAGRFTFTDERCTPARLLELRALFLSRRLARIGRSFVIWGAGQTGRRLARALEAHGLRAEAFIDIDPEKVGRSARGAPIVDAHDALAAGGVARRHLVVVAVGARGARATVLARLRAASVGDVIAAA